MIEQLSHDTGLWVLFSFVIFAAVAFKLGRASVTGALDGKIDKIRQEIESAENLRVEAQETLAQFQRKQRDAKAEAKDIIEKAKQHAEAIRKQAEDNHAAVMQRREQQLTERLKRIEENAIADIQNHAAAVSVQATAEIIAQTLDEKTNADLVDQSIQGAVKQIN